MTRDRWNRKPPTICQKKARKRPSVLGFLASSRVQILTIMITEFFNLHFEKNILEKHVF